MSTLLQKKIGINSKTAAINIILIANAIAWYLCIYAFLKNGAESKGFVGNNLIILIGVNLLVLILAGIFSSKLIEKIENRLKFLVYWVTAGVFLSIIPLAVESASFVELVALFGLIGGYFGLGLPVFMGYYSASTETENRGRTSGIIVFLMGLFVVLLLITSGYDATRTTIVLAVWRTFGLVSLIFLNPPDLKINKKEKTTYKGLIKSYSILLYFLPWLLFSLVNNFAYVILDNSGYATDITGLSNNVENIIVAITAIFSGFLADYIGRKRLMLFGFALIGLGYAALGLLPTHSMQGWWFYIFADGVAWGTFTTLFMLTIWGDLADKRDSEKFYLIGFIPYLLSNFIKVSTGQFMTEMMLGTVFSFASFFLFAAVLPLYLAPETLAEKAMKDRNLKSYLDKAQKMAEKEVAKNRKSTDEDIQEVVQEKQDETESSEQKNSQEYDEAKKLAEQYY
jgi:hypothetical protein